MKIELIGFDNLSDRVIGSFRKIKETEVNKLRQKLEDESPVGATGRLKIGWQSVFSNDFEAVILNTAEASLFRVIGRGPGKPPPIGKIAPWAALKGIPAGAVATKIAKYGTERWISGENIVGFKKRSGTELKPNSPPLQTANEIAKQFQALKF